MSAEGGNTVNVRCTTCKSGRSFPQPPYPVKVQHSCDSIEPGRAYWALLPDTYEPPTGALR